MTTTQVVKCSVLSCQGNGGGGLLSSLKIESDATNHSYTSALREVRY